MTHPSDGELFDLRRGEISEERARELQAHLEDCARCRGLWEDLEAMEVRLDTLEPARPDEVFAARTMDALKDELWGRSDAPARKASGRARMFRWSRRLAWAAGIIAATLLFQAGVWSPLPATANIQALVSLSGSDYAPESWQAAVDSVLVIRVFEGPQFEVPFASERYDLEGLLTLLKDREIKGQFRQILFEGGVEEATVTLREEDLRPLAEAAGVSNMGFGGGIVAIMQGPSVRTRLGQPVEVFVTAEGGERHVAVRTAVAVQDSVKARILSRVRQAVEVPVRVITSRTGEGWTVLSMDVGSGDIRLHAVTGSDDARRRELLSTESATLTVTDAGTLVLDRQYLETAELERALRRLHDRHPAMGLTILLPEGSEDLQARLVEIANRVGIPDLNVKIVKK